MKHLAIGQISLFIFSVFHWSPSVGKPRCTPVSSRLRNHTSFRWSQSQYLPHMIPVSSVKTTESFRFAGPDCAGQCIAELAGVYEILTIKIRYAGCLILSFFLTLKAPTTTAADDIHKYFSLFFKENKTWPRGYKTFFVLNSTEHGIFPAHKC